jgi:hypothetical protein
MKRRRNDGEKFGISIKNQKLCGEIEMASSLNQRRSEDKSFRDGNIHQILKICWQVV